MKRRHLLAIITLICICASAGFFALAAVSIAPSLHLTCEIGPTTKIRGEAVIVDLGKRGKLFGLLW